MTPNIFRKETVAKEIPVQEESGKGFVPRENLFRKQLEQKEIAPKPESAGKSFLRTLYQIPSAIAQRATWPLNLLQAIGTGEAINEYSELKEKLPRLKELFPDRDWSGLENLSEEDYLKSVQQSAETFPTQQNIERLVEEKTGAPLTPKTELQKNIHLATTGAAFRPGGVVPKATAALVAPTAKKGFEELGVPEAFSEFGGLLASGAAPTPSIGAKIKPSGMPLRQFEKIEKPTTVTPARHEAITDKLEGDFRKVTDQLLEKKSRTYSAMKEDTTFKEKVGDLFNDVQTMSENIPGKIESKDLKKIIVEKYNTRESKGISPDEFERSLRKQVGVINKEIPEGELNASQLVSQYRKNNKSLRELYEPGKSAASNRAKKEALLEYNRAIEEVINTKYPDSEFSKLFKFTNKRWQELNDIEQINKFTSDVFNGKVNFRKAKQIFSRDEAVKRPFERLLGKEGFEDMKQITEDLLSAEKSLGYIKKARGSGFGDLATTAAVYVASPKVGVARSAFKGGKSLYQMLLDKPQMRVTFRNAYDSLKDGNYKEAQKYFTILDSEVKNQTKEDKSPK